MPRPSLLMPEPVIHRLNISVYGTPAPQGSKKHVGRGILVDDNAPALRTWREDVKLATLRALDATPGWERDYRAVVGTFWFTMARPKSHYRTGKNADLLLDSAPHAHALRPDLDKLLRSTWDALTTAGAYTDDSRLIQVHASKAYTTAVDTSPGVLITLAGVRP